MGLAFPFFSFPFRPRMLYAMIPTILTCSIRFLRDIGRKLINPHNIMYNGDGCRLLKRKPPLGDRLALFAFLARGECTCRSVISPQVVLFLHFIDAHNPIFGGECFLCKNRTVHNGVSADWKKLVRAGRTHQSTLGLAPPWEASGSAHGPAPVGV